MTMAHAMSSTIDIEVGLGLVGDILDIIERKDWDLFRSTVLSNASNFLAISNYIAKCTELNGVTLLHAVVRFNPPLDIVSKMIEIDPDLPAAKDCIRRTPLHVAAGSAAAPKLIKFMAHAYPPSCDARDEDGKTPLHFACDTTCELFEDDSAVTNQKVICHDAILALLSESICASTIEDMDEMNPVEYAIMSDAPLKTVTLLQRASRKYFERLQSSKRSIGHPPGASYGEMTKSFKNEDLNRKCARESRRVSILPEYGPYKYNAYTPPLA